MKTTRVVGVLALVASVGFGFACGVSHSGQICSVDKDCNAPAMCKGGVCVEPSGSSGSNGSSGSSGTTETTGSTGSTAGTSSGTTGTSVCSVEGAACDSDGKHFCKSGSCIKGCKLSDGAVVPDGTHDSLGSCEACQADRDVTKYTPIDNGTACAANGGNVCDNGTCQSGCWISGARVASGATSPSNACQACQPGLSITAYTNRFEGASCGAAGSANFCHDSGSGTRTCQQGCFIDNAFFTSGQGNPGPDATNHAACQYCDLSRPTSWSARSNGYDCAAQSVCNESVCTKGCWIGGAYYADQASVAECSSCDVTQSTHAVTPKPQTTTCGPVPSGTNQNGDTGANYDHCGAASNANQCACTATGTSYCCAPYKAVRECSETGGACHWTCLL